MQELKKCKKILIEVNQTCNLNCTYCFYRDYGRTKQSLRIEDIDALLVNCPDIEEFYLTGGECFTSPIIDNIIELLSKKSKVITFTNGVMLNKYDDLRLKSIVNNVQRFIITFDSFDVNNYKCRNKLSETIDTIKRILELDPSKLEIKVCINEYNYQDLEMIFSNLVNMGVKYLSVNFVFDINNSDISHEIKQIQQLKHIFEIINKYGDYFNDSYVEMLYDLYINNKINEKFPCTADRDYFFLDSSNNYLICPGNCKKIGNRGNWKECFSKECANEWEMMYTR